jgi:hypothetical protein
MCIDYRPHAEAKLDTNPSAIALNPQRNTPRELLGRLEHLVSDLKRLHPDMGGSFTVGHDPAESVAF